MRQYLPKEMRSLIEIIDARRAGLVAGAALITGVLILGIHFLGSGDFEWADALTEVVMLIATTVIIVGLVEWYARRRWRRAESEDLRSLMLIAYVSVTGWSRPRHLVASDFDPEKFMGALQTQLEVLSKARDGLESIHQTLGKGDLHGFNELSTEQWAFKAYYGEGSRTRRIEYLSILADKHLSALTQRRDDATLFGLLVGLRDNVMWAAAAAHHADAVIREMVLADRRPILLPFLESHRDLGAVDPVLLLDRVVAYMTSTNDIGDLLIKLSKRESGIEELVFAASCSAAVRNEIEFVERSLGALREIVRILAPEIKKAVGEVGIAPKMEFAGPGRSPVV